MTSLPGDDGKTSLHVHIMLGLSDQSRAASTSSKGTTVHPTLEVVLTETPAKLRRRKRRGLGIVLIEADARQASRDQ